MNTVLISVQCKVRTLIGSGEQGGECDDHCGVTGLFDFLKLVLKFMRGNLTRSREDTALDQFLVKFVV